MADYEKYIPLVSGCLLHKSVEGDDTPWTFSAIASDEEEDTEGDVISKEVIDLSYAQRRGFVNWNHSRAVEDQIGFLTKAELIEGGMIKSLSEKFGVPLSKTASIYVEGELYRHVPAAQGVRNILRSAKPGYNSSLGVSIDGVVAMSKETGNLVKALIRGVAFTHAPAHVLTMSMLSKTLAEMGATEKNKKLTYDQALLWLLDRRPNWPYEFAKKVTNYFFENKGENYA